VTSNRPTEPGSVPWFPKCLQRCRPLRSRTGGRDRSTHQTWPGQPSAGFLTPASEPEQCACHRSPNRVYSLCPFDLVYELLFMAFMDTPRQQDRRQYPRTRVSWPIVVQAGASRYLTSSLDISPFGAKVRIKTHLKLGTSVQLEVMPSEGPPLRVGAMVWRVDRDGLAFLFSSGIRHRLLRTSHPFAARSQEVAGRA
jgi:hypothetical protein